MTSVTLNGVVYVGKPAVDTSGTRTYTVTGSIQRIDVPFDDLPENHLIGLAEQLGFTPEWFDDGESILGVAMWVAPDGTWHTIHTLREAVRKHITTPLSLSPSAPCS